ncbi:MAG: hypothetical protein EB127_28345 [Alphaproteobacteria bacterium]|nr:hypothetical protein [Alphaproteobacteria bacterium]
MRSLVTGGADPASIFYADDAEEFGKKAIEAGLQEVTTFGCMDPKEMLPLTQFVVERAIREGRIVEDKIVGAGLDQSKWEMINAKFVEKVRLMQSARGGVGGEEAQGGAAEAPRVPQRSGPGYERVRSATSGIEVLVI